MKTIILTDIGQRKIEIIRTVRQYTGAGLKEAKDAVEMVKDGNAVAITEVPADIVATVLSEFAKYGATATELNDERSLSEITQMKYCQPAKVSESAPATKASVACAPKQVQKPKPKHYVDTSLKGYLREVASLECQALTQNRLMNQLANRANSLGKARYIEEPDAPRYDSWNGQFVGEVAAAIIFVCLVTCLIVDFAEAIIIIVVCSLILILDFTPDIIRHRIKLKKHKEVLEKHKEALRVDAVRVEKELVLREEVVRQYNAVKKEKDRTNQALWSLYSVGIIHPDYHNFVAVSSIYDYLDKGICFRLTGPGGAYAFYEEALRFKRIETRLDVIINKLDEIIANQQHIAGLIQEGNATLRRIEQQNNNMAANLDRIEENTAATEYNTRCAAHSAAVMESIAVYRTLKYD